jgi:hypothetical protein
MRFGICRAGTMFPGIGSFDHRAELLLKRAAMHSMNSMMEDVAILEGRIDMQKYRWQPDLDELLWKPSAAWDDE